jgi:protease-4
VSLETETVLDRRRLRRQISLWRVLAVLAIVAALGAFAISRSDGLGFDKRQIARVKIEGVISDDRDLQKMLKKIAEAKHVQGVLLAINSPGGTTTGGEALFESLRRLAEKKPVVAQFGTVAASAAYIAGLGADHIVARGNTITGSVGVIVQWPDLSGMLDKIGVRMNEVKSGPLKATPSPFQPTDERGRALTEEMVREGQRWFLGLVSARRGIDPTTVPGLTDGRIYSGREALRLRLVDEIGGEQEAVRWLVGRGVSDKAKVVDWKPENDDDWSFTRSAAAFAGSVASGVFDGLRDTVQREMGLGGVGLDGFVSVWQPAKN